MPRTANGLIAFTLWSLMMTGVGIAILSRTPLWGMLIGRNGG